MKTCPGPLVAPKVNSLGPTRHYLQGSRRAHGAPSHPRRRELQGDVRQSPGTAGIHKNGAAEHLMLDERSTAMVRTRRADAAADGEVFIAERHHFARRSDVLRRENLLLGLPGRSTAANAVWQRHAHLRGDRAAQAAGMVIGRCRAAASRAQRPMFAFGETARRAEDQTGRTCQSAAASSPPSPLIRIHHKT